MPIIFVGIGVFIFLYLILSAFTDGGGGALEKRIARVGPAGNLRKVTTKDRTPKSLRHTKDTGVPFIDSVIRLLPNPEKLRSRLMKTGKKISLGEYLLANALCCIVAYLITRMIGWSLLPSLLFSYTFGAGIPHFVTGYMGAKRIKTFMATFPEAIDTMCRGLRSGLPVTESIASVGREMPDPIGYEFNRIADGVRMGKTLESSMWEVARRIDIAEFRFLIIAMAIQKETGGNLAETLGNLSDLIRRRRQLRLKIKAMSSEAKASAMIIGAMPFVAFLGLYFLSPDYIGNLTHTQKGHIWLGIGLGWMGLGWGVMLKMISFEI